MESQLINTGTNVLTSHILTINHKSKTQKYLLTPFSYKIATFNACQNQWPS